MLLQQRAFDEAVQLFRAASDAEPYNATAAYNLATALTRAGQTDAGQQAMRRFQTLRDSAYAVTYAQGYLQQGRYGEAMASTGAEPDLVDRATPAVTFTDASSAAFAAATPSRAPGPGAVLLFDVDNDGDLDLLTIGADGQHLFRNDGGRFSDVTAAAHLRRRIGWRRGGCRRLRQRRATGSAAADERRWRADAPARRRLVRRT